MIFNNFFKDNVDFYKLKCMENSHCYYYKYIKQKNGLFENIVDVVFILLMEGSKRENNVYLQLNKHNLHSNIIIQFNKGFKHCKKNLNKQLTVYDLVDAYKQIFIQCRQNNYNNVLILEDDFIITENIQNKEYLNNIKTFINKNNYDLLNLGGLTSFHFKCNNFINRFISGCYIQAVIYNKSYYDKFLNSNLRDADQLLYEVNKIKKYNVNIPIIIQPLPLTDNRKNWRFDILRIPEKLFNIDWNKNYKGKELKYWKKYYFFYNTISLSFKLIIFIVISLLIIKLLNYKYKNKQKIYSY